MPDNYKGIELEEEEETSTNPHRSITKSVYAYYYCKTINIEFLALADNAVVEIINTDNGKVKTEYVLRDDRIVAIDISGMGIGNYSIRIEVNGGSRYFGSMVLY